MIPVHLVTGFLGAGKTTLLTKQLAARADLERCAVIVNDFGDAQFDATLLGGKAQVMDIPGGCVCCTAPENLAPSIKALIATVSPDRIFIEATGLARPADIVDTLRRALEPGTIEIAPVVAVVDPDRWASGNDIALIEEQLSAADIIVMNLRSSAGGQNPDALASWADKRHPPPLNVTSTDTGETPTTLFDKRYESPIPWQPHDHHDHASTAGWVSASRMWGPEIVFDMGTLRTLLTETSAERIKGIFHTDIGWYQTDRAGGHFDRSPTPFHSQNRVDVIMKGTQDEVDDVLAKLDRARWQPPTPGQVEEVLLQKADGSTQALTRDQLRALETQIADVAEYVPGRAGEGVWLRDVLAGVATNPGTSFVVVAHDGMTTEPIAVAEVGDAILVHSLDGMPFPIKKGGPFRIYVPPDAGRSACSNVKKVARLVIE